MVKALSRSFSSRPRICWEKRVICINIMLLLYENNNQKTKTTQKWEWENCLWKLKATIRLRYDIHFCVVNISARELPWDHETSIYSLITFLNFFTHDKLSGLCRAHRVGRVDRMKREKEACVRWVKSCQQQMQVPSYSIHDDSIVNISDNKWMFTIPTWAYD